MNYHKHGSYNGHTYQWANFKTYGVDTDDALMDLGQLFVDLGLPVNLNMQYSLSGSGAFVTDVPRTFANFGYATGSVVNIHGETIYNNILANRPIYARGEDINSGVGHAWVIDGSEGWHTYQNYTIYYYDRDWQLVHQEIETREEGFCTYGGAHCNWGWGGSGDCWVSINAFTPYGRDYEFKKNNKMVSAIRPR